MEHGSPWEGRKKRRLCRCRRAIRVMGKWRQENEVFVQEVIVRSELDV